MSDRLPSLTPGSYLMLMVALGVGLAVCLAVQLDTVLRGMTP